MPEKRRIYTGHNFSNRILVGADFTNCDCSSCDFSNSDLSFANFKGANLYRAKFKGSILYVTNFENCDLTRADFDQSYLYGIKFVGSVNVTRAEFNDHQLEPYRRESDYRLNQNNFKIIESESKRNAVEYNNFSVGNHKVSFSEYKVGEQPKMKAEIHNRLKRIFSANGFNEEARQHRFYECYWVLRSALYNFRLSKQWFKKNLPILMIYFLSEKICGYGEKPFRAALSFLIWVFIFSIIYPLVPLIFEGNNLAIGSPLRFTSGIASIGQIWWESFYQCFLISTTLGSSKLLISGKLMQLLVTVEVFGAILLVGIFIATMVRYFQRI